MAKFSGPTTLAKVNSPIEVEARTWTYEGAPGFVRDVKSELFLLAVTNMVGEDTFYESADGRDSRFTSLVHQVIAEDPDWVARFIPYLRTGMLMRTASVVAAVEYARAGGPDGRKVVNSACERADEPAEALGYWLATYGRPIPIRIRRGIADAAVRLYTERNALRYDGGSRSVRMGDVIDLCHPKPKATWQGDLFRYLLDKRHNRAEPRVGACAIISARQVAEAIPADQRRARLNDVTVQAALTSWEWLSGWLSDGMDAQAWEAAIPNMGYMALLRNLRNFDQADISDEVRKTVEEKLADPDEVARSRQFPLRFLSAWKEAHDLRWGPVLESALEYSTKTIPKLDGRTAIVVDMSGSMQAGLSERGTLTRYEAASLFAGALAKACGSVFFVPFSHEHRIIGYERGRSALRTAEQILNAVPHGGTYLWAAVSAALAEGPDRLVVLTDEQAHDSGDHLTLPARSYLFDLSGYRPATSDRMHVFGGLSDKAFALLPMLERSRSAGWPF